MHKKLRPYCFWSSAPGNENVNFQINDSQFPDQILYDFRMAVAVFINPF